MAIHEITNLYLRNQFHSIVALIVENELNLAHAYLYLKKFCMDKKITATFPSPPNLPWGHKNLV
jgi:hypothetical protein